jgi:hypothetical protein
MPITDFNLLVSSSISADSGNLLSITSAASDANTTNSVAAMTFKNTVAHTAGDLEFQFRRSDDASLLKITDSYTSIAGQLYLPDSNMAMTGSGIYSPAYRGLSSNYAVTLISDMADGASAIGTVASTSAVWSNAAAKLLSIRNGNIERSYLTGDGLFNGGVNAIGGVSATALATPVNGTHTTTTTGGTLVPGTYYYRVSATNALGETLASTETSKVVPAGTNTNTVTVVWGVVMGATGYKVYGRTTGAELLMATIASGNTLLWLDAGSVGPAGALPTANSTGGVAVTGTASGANAISFGTSGQRLSLSPSANQYLSSNGTNILAASGIIIENALVASSSGLTSNSAATIGIRGNKPDGASAVGVVIGNDTALANAGAKLVSFWNGYPTEVAYIDKDGNYITSGDVGNLLYGKPTWVGTVVTAAGVPVSTASTAVPFTLTAGSVYFVQPDVSCYLEVIAAGSMTLAGAKSVVLEALEKYYFQVKTGSLVYSFDVASGGANIKFFQMS